MGGTDANQQEVKVFNPTALVRDVYAWPREEKIPCIKFVRTASGWGLKEAKDFIEYIWERPYGISPVVTEPVETLSYNQLDEPIRVAFNNLVSAVMQTADANANEYDINNILCKF